MKYIAFLALLCGVFSDPVENDVLKEFSNDQKFISGVYKELSKTETGNFIVSPLSLKIILALTNEGARGETSTEIVSTLNLPSPNEKIQSAIKTLLPQLKRDDDKLQLLSANRIYTGKSVLLEESFRSIATNIYGSGVEGVDFAKAQEAAATINKWVEDNTNNKIKDLLKPEDLSEDVKLALVNALYFKGKWLSKFKERSTTKKKFFKTNEDSVDVDTMHQIQHFNYYENPTLNAKFLELPYEGDNINMIIVLPNKREGLHSLEQNIEQLLSPQPWVNKRVDVELPRFTMDTKIEFIPILEKLGIKKLFGDADLTGLSSTNKDLYVSYIVQKAFVNVTESGTEAAAATAVLGVERSGHVYRPPIVTFHADHPFLYVIEKDGVTLFIGRYTNP